MKVNFKIAVLSVLLLSGAVPEASGQDDSVMRSVPDSAAVEIPKLTLYQYEYQLIPMLLGQMGVSPEFMDNLSDTRYINEFLLTLMGLECDFDLSGISAEKISRAGREVVVYTFPIPKRIPDAKYGAIVAFDDRYRYFTLEKSLDGYWVLGESEYSPGKGPHHMNYGAVPESESPEMFVDLIELKGFLK